MAHWCELFNDLKLGLNINASGLSRDDKFKASIFECQQGYVEDTFFRVIRKNGSKNYLRQISLKKFHNFKVV